MGGLNVCLVFEGVKYDPERLFSMTASEYVCLSDVIHTVNLFDDGTWADEYYLCAERFDREFELLAVHSAMRAIEASYPLGRRQVARLFLSVNTQPADGVVSEYTLKGCSV